MKKNTFLFLGMLAVVLTFGVLLTACSKKAEAQTGGDAAGAVKNAAGAAKGLASALDKALAGDATAEAINAFADALKSASPADLAGLNAKASPGGDFSYDLNKEGNGIIIKQYTGQNKVLIFPAEIEGYPVVQIGNNNQVTKFEVDAVVIPENVRIISSSAFSGRKLRAATFPASLTTIENMAFRRTLLQSVDLSLCTSLTKIEGGVSSDAGAFSECTLLQTVKLPDSVTVIGAKTFIGCKALTDINIPAGIQSLGYVEDNPYYAGNVFTGCGELYNLVIPESITNIKILDKDLDGNFKGCGKLPLATRKRLQDLGYKGTF